MYYLLLLVIINLVLSKAIKTIKKTLDSNQHNINIA